MLAQLIEILDAATGVGLEHAINDIEGWMYGGILDTGISEDREWFVDHLRDMTGAE